MLRIVLHGFCSILNGKDTRLRSQYTSCCLYFCVQVSFSSSTTHSLPCDDTNYSHQHLASTICPKHVESHSANPLMRGLLFSRFLTTARRAKGGEGGVSCIEVLILYVALGNRLKESPLRWRIWDKRCTHYVFSNAIGICCGAVPMRVLTVPPASESS